MSIYRSNLVAPDLQPHFVHTKLVEQPGSFGHSVLTHWADKPDTEEWRIWKACGSMTHDEAAILYHCAKRRPGLWLDIGANLGWTSLHIAVGTNCFVQALDPQFKSNEWEGRAMASVRNCDRGIVQLLAGTSREAFDFLEHMPFLPLSYAGVMIDGDHSPGEPLHDAQQAAAHLNEIGVIVFHDFIGGPVREGVLWLMDHGFQCRVYETPFMVAVCWRGDFAPPDHVPDPHLRQYDLRGRCEGFPFERCT